MDALTLLTADHNRVRGLFTRFKAAKEEGSPEVAALGATIAKELEVHTSIEEQHFYPWARGLSDEIKELIEEGVEEHHVVNVLLEELAQLDPTDETWGAKMTVLIENVEHHAEEEEQEMFPMLRSASSAEDREEMGVTLEEAKAALGAPVLADKIDLTTGELKKLASEQEIPGRSTMPHDELAATVAPPGP
jgi:hemerythrin superfamily protein